MFYHMCTKTSNTMTEDERRLCMTGHTTSVSCHKDSRRAPSIYDLAYILSVSCHKNSRRPPSIHDWACHLSVTCHKNSRRAPFMHDWAYIHSISRHKNSRRAPSLHDWACHLSVSCHNNSRRAPSIHDWAYHLSVFCRITVLAICSFTLLVVWCFKSTLLNITFSSFVVSITPFGTRWYLKWKNARYSVAILRLWRKIRSRTRSTQYIQLKTLKKSTNYLCLIKYMLYCRKVGFYEQMGIPTHFSRTGW